MGTRKVKITTYGKDLNKILDQLKTTIDKISNITVDVEVPDNKETYQYLSTSQLIEDWNIINENSKDTEEEYVSKNSEDLENYIKGILLGNNRIETIENLYYFIKAITNLKLKSPGFRFSKKVIDDYIYPIYLDFKNNTASVEDLALIKIINIYYSKACINTIISDLVSKIKENWKQLELKISGIRDIIKLFFEF